LRRYYLLWVSILGLACPAGHAIPWFPFGPDGGSARSLTADPKDSKHIYLGAANGWVYQSRDGGRKWERLARIGNRDDLVIDNIEVDPADTKRLLVGAYVPEGKSDGGIFISEDRGANWVSQPEMAGQSVRSLTVAPSNPRIFVAGTLEGVFRSNDSGAHWERISPKDNAEIHEVESLAIDPIDPDIIYAGTWHLPWKTVDGGANWKSIKQGIIEDSDVFSILVDPKHSNVVYLSACSGIYKSDDAGEKFLKVQGIPTTARRTRVLMQDPANLDTVFAGTTEGLYRTFDAGAFWMQTTGSGLIVNDVYVDPANPKHVLLATDRSGVMASDDGGDSFLPSNKGFSARYITAFAQDVQHPSTVYVGLLNDKGSGGVFVSHTGALSWTHISEGLDGQDVFSLAQVPDGTILAGTEHGIYRLEASVWQRAGDGGKPAAAAAPPVETSAAPASSRAKTMRKPTARTMARRRQAAKTRVATSHSPTASPALKGFDGSVYGFAVVSDMLFAASSQGMLRSPSSGTAWSLVRALPIDDWRFVASSKTTIVAATLKALQISTDAGDTWQAASLPDKVTQVSALALDGRGTVWIADRDAVYFSADGARNWQQLDDPYMRNVNSLYFDAQGDRVLVTTNGPGTKAFAVQIPSMEITTMDTGWNLRFVRPVGDYLVGATLFDGIVVQPRMVDSPLIAVH